MISNSIEIYESLWLWLRSQLFFHFVHSYLSLCVFSIVLSLCLSRFGLFEDGNESVTTHTTKTMKLLFILLRVLFLKPKMIITCWPFISLLRENVRNSLCYLIIVHPSHPLPPRSSPLRLTKAITISACWLLLIVLGECFYFLIHFGKFKDASHRTIACLLSCFVCTRRIATVELNHDEWIVSHVKFPHETFSAVAASAGGGSAYKIEIHANVKL